MSQYFNGLTHVSALLYSSVYGLDELGPVAIPPHLYQGGDDGLNAKYKVLGPLAVIEILDKNNHPIEENGKKGIIVVSHLVKRQQPMLRYLMGDIAIWTDFTHDIFTLHGRDAVSLKICNAHLPVTSAWRVIGPSVQDWRPPSGHQDGKARRARESHGHEKRVPPVGPVGNGWGVTGPGLGAAAQGARRWVTSSNATTKPGGFARWNLGPS